VYQLEEIQICVKIAKEEAHVDARSLFVFVFFFGDSQVLWV
jgi:hypothetical protein